MSTVAIILARGGSKRIPGKNLINFCGKPLLLWTIEQCQKVKEIDSIWVSSDDDFILMLGNANGCQTIHRPMELSVDGASSESGWLHALKSIEKKQGKVDIAICPQVTSPIREPKDMRDALQEFKQNNKPFMLSCTPEGVQNGSFYIFKTNDFRKHGFPRGLPRTVPQDPRMGKFYMESWKGYEIDYPIEIKDCEVLMKHFLLNDPYYKTREVTFADDYYEKDYWQNTIDPDGKIRKMEEEQQKQLEDAKEELAFINALPPGNILDVGCGLGHLLSGVNAAWNKFGVDISKWATDRAKKYGKIFNGTLYQAKYESDMFDAVILYHVLEHLFDPIQLLIEIRRVLKPNGKLILGTPNFTSEVAQRFNTKFRLLKDVGHISLFGTSGLFRLLTDLNFRVEKISYPYFNTVHFTEKNFLRLFDTSKISPPFHGNIMTVYSHKQ